MSDQHQHDVTGNGETPGEPQEAPGYEMPAPPSGEARRCRTAFLVIVEQDGLSWATNDVNLDVIPERQASFHEMYGSCSQVMRDIEISMQAERTVGMMMQATAQIAEAQRQDKIAQKLMSKGIHVPGR